jgi:hypothetical protein
MMRSVHLVGGIGGMKRLLAMILQRGALSLLFSRV